VALLEDGSDGVVGERWWWCWRRTTALAEAVLEEDGGDVRGGWR
jgi:hypothetical protein